jgi:hypothetical protein
MPTLFFFAVSISVSFQCGELAMENHIELSLQTCQWVDVRPETPSIDVNMWNKINTKSSIWIFFFLQTVLQHLWYLVCRERVRQLGAIKVEDIEGNLFI